MIMMNGPFASARSLMWRPKLRCNHCPLRRWLLLMLLQGDGTPSGLSGALNVVTFCWILPARLLRCNLIGGILGTVNRMFFDCLDVAFGDALLADGSFTDSFPVSPTNCSQSLLCCKVLVFIMHTPCIASSYSWISMQMSMFPPPF